MLRRAAACALAALLALPVLGARPAPEQGSAPVGAHPAGVRGPGVRADRIRDGEYWLDDYGTRAAWKTSRGAGTTVAVIDTGVDGAVPDLAGAVAGGTDVSGVGAADGQRPIGTESGHGTWVASLLAGRGTADGAGLIGVAPEARILSVSVDFDPDADVPGADEQVARAMRWSVDHGADVINLSLTRNTLGWPESWDEAFRYAFRHDVVVVAAAGNRGSGTKEVGAPATIPGVLAVAGVGRDGRASVDASSQGITLGVAAPSEDLLGADPSGGYVRWAGTSGAAPIVAGVVALVRSAHPGLDADDVLNRVIRTARPVGRVPGPRYGYGLVDAAAAVTASPPSVSANPLGDLDEWIRLHRRAAASPAPAPSVAAPGPARRHASERGPAPLAPGWGVVTRVGIPILVLFGTALFAVLLVLAFRRHFGRGGGRE